MTHEKPSDKVPGEVPTYLELPMRADLQELRACIRIVLSEKAGVTEPGVSSNMQMTAGLFPWPAEIMRIPFHTPKDMKDHVGPGEQRLAAMWGGEVFGGSVSMDVQASDGSKWEVKKPDGPQCSGRVLIEQEGIRAIQPALDALKAVTNKLVRMFDPKMTSNSNLVEKQFPPEQLDVIRHFLFGNNSINVQGLLRGEIGKDRIAGLTDTLRRVAGILNRPAYQRSASERKPPPVSTGIGDDMFSKDFAMDVYVSVAKKLGMSAEQIIKVAGATDEDFMQQAFFVGGKKSTSLAFSKPDEFVKRYWTDAIRASEVFGETDGVVLVSEQFYRVVPKQQLDAVFALHSITKGKPKLYARPSNKEGSET